MTKQIEKHCTAAPPPPRGLTGYSNAVRTSLKGFNFVNVGFPSFTGAQTSCII